MKARWRARVNASYRADGCSSASRQSRMILKLLTAPALRPVRPTTPRNACLILPSPCQSELKRTLRRGAPLPISVRSPAFAQASGAHSTGMVNGRFPRAANYGFEMVDARGHAHFAARISSIENLHRIKSVGFFANFRRFKFNATLAIYRRLLVRNRLRDNRNGCEESQRN